MRRALDLARERRGLVWPNPPVGCVIVKDGAAAAEAATQRGGRPHAERKALDEAGRRAEAATLYVTFEPCSHWGKTPPCADAIIAARVARVVCAIQDPDPRVDGRGFAKLRENGVEVRVGVCAEEAARVMSGFLHRVRYGAPELVLLPERHATPPDGADALIFSSGSDVCVVSRSGTIDVNGVDAEDLLRRLGEIGLTSAAIHRCDPVAESLLQSAANMRIGGSSAHRSASVAREIPSSEGRSAVF